MRNIIVDGEEFARIAAADGAPVAIGGQRYAVAECDAEAGSALAAQLGTGQMVRLVRRVERPAVKRRREEERMSREGERLRGRVLGGLADAFRQFARNGRWGCCAACPRDRQGNAYPEFCPYTEGHDHQGDVDELAVAWKRHLGVAQREPVTQIPEEATDEPELVGAAEASG